MTTKYSFRLKCVLLSFLFTAIVSFGSTANALSPGDIAFLGVNSDEPAYFVRDDFSFLLLVDIPSGTEIRFTSAGWFDDDQFATISSSSNGYVQWTASSPLSAGTIIHIWEDEFAVDQMHADSGTASYVKLDPLAGWSVSGAGDQILAFQGNMDETAGFIAGIHFNRQVGETTDTNWDGNSLNSSTRSALPDTLTGGVNAVWVWDPSGLTDTEKEIDNMLYTGSLTSGSQSELLAAINNNDNWTKSRVTTYDQANDLPVFNVFGACSDPDVPTLTPNPTSTCPGGSSTLNISGSLNDATSWQLYAGSCGGSNIGNTPSSSFQVSPSSTTTYYVRGEGGCVTPGSCGTATVTASDTTKPTISCPGNQTLNANGSGQATLPDYTSLASAADNCDPSPTVSQSPTAGTTIGSTTTITLTATDASSNFNTCTFDVSLVDVTPPANASTYPKSANLTETSVDLLVQINENGNGYYIVVAGGSAAPTAAQTKARTTYSGVPIIKSGTAAQTANTEKSFNITGLTAGTSYDIYYVAEDAEPNLQASPTKVSITTLAPVIGVSKTASVSGNQITVDYYLENLGDVPLSNLSLPDDLDSVFGAGNYSMTSGPSLIDDPGTIIVNGGFDGSGDIALISSGTLSTGETAQIRIVVDITTLADMGSGLGVYSNQVTASADGPTTDLSDNGTDPDPNGNGNPAEAGENDPTPITVAIERVVGVSKTASVSGSAVTIDYYLENFGNASLSNLSLPDDLDSVFGAGNYGMTSGPSLIDDPGTITVNGGFDGSGDTALISSGTLSTGETAQIRIVVDITMLTDQGSGLGVYSNQVMASADGPTSDLSDNGTDPDPNGNGNPAEAGENDPTPITVAIERVIGVSKTASVSGSAVTIDYYLENFGNASLSNLSLPDDLDAVFGAGNYTLISAPSLIDDPGTMVVNGGFDGSGDTALISSGTLSTGETAQIRIVVDITMLTDQGSGLGVYSNQVMASADGPTSDLSDNGTDPDPNGNGDPTEAGEDDPTPITLDGTAPTVTAGNISLSGASGTGGVFKVGDTVTAVWDNTAGGDNNTDISSVTVDFSQFGGGAAVAATNNSDTWTATYAITEDGGGSIDAVNRNVSVTATDNTANDTTTADTTNAAVDNDSPTVTDAHVSISGGSGTAGAFIIDDIVSATWNNTGAGENNSDTIIGVTVDFTAFGGGAAVAASNSSDTWTATYTIVAGAIEAGNLNVSVTAVDNAGNPTTAADTGNATVDNIAPGSATGALTVEENSADNTVVGTVSATGATAFSLTDNAGGRFTIHPTTGQVTVVDGSLLNYEVNRSHGLTVRATDASGNSTDTGMTVSVTDVNEAPTLSGTYDLGSTDEDVKSATVTGATILADAGITYNDVDEGALSGLAVTDATGNGTWKYNDGLGNWNSFGTVAPGTALLLDSATEIRFVPDANLSGPASLTFRAWDQTSGSASGNETPIYADSTANGGATAFSIGTAALTLIVNPVNDPPTFTGTPAINGTPMEGNTLSLTDTGTADGDPGDTVTLSYQWQSDNGDINGATDATYKLTADEVGKTVTCEFAADDGNGELNSTAMVETGGVTVLPDTDLDGVTDASDNCPNVANNNQSDVNSNSIGDACDTASDTDHDGLSDADETVIFGSAPDNPNSDGDSLGDLEEVARGRGPSTFNSQMSLVVDEVADFNGDGMADLLLRDTTTGYWQMIQLNGAAIIGDDQVILPPPLAWSPLHIGDFDGDGKADAIFRNIVTGNWRLGLFDGSTRLDYGAMPMTTKLDWQTVGFADFNADGNLDVAMRNTTTGEWNLVLLDGLTKLNNSRLQLREVLDWQPQHIGDFNNDGKADICLRNTLTGEWEIHFFDGTTRVDWFQLPMTPDLDWQPARFVDFDGNGQLDVVLRNRVSGRWNFVALNGGVKVSSDPLLTRNNLDWQPLFIGDFDGDSQGDILFRNTVSGIWELHLFAGAVRTGYDSMPISTDLDWQPQRIGDFNYDGNYDVLLRHRVSGAWSLVTLSGTTEVSTEAVAVSNDLKWVVER